MSSRCYYSVLGVSPTASPQEIKVAYKRLAVTLHPDKPGGSTAAFQNLAEAYQLLSNDDTRLEYDEERRRCSAPMPPPQRQAPAHNTGGWSMQQQQHQQQHQDHHSSSFDFDRFHSEIHSRYAFSDPFVLFESFFGNGVAPDRSRGGQHRQDGGQDLFANDPFSFAGGGAGGMFAGGFAGGFGMQQQQQMMMPAGGVIVGGGGGGGGGSSSYSYSSSSFSSSSSSTSSSSSSSVGQRFSSSSSYSSSSGGGGGGASGQTVTSTSYTGSDGRTVSKRTETIVDRDGNRRTTTSSGDEWGR